MTLITSRAFNQETGVAKKCAANGPVFITDRGRPSHVLLTFAAYEKLLSAKPSFLQMIGQEGDDDFDFVAPKLSEPIAREFEFE
jgi:hypothetical protein